MSLQTWLGGIRLTKAPVSFAKVNFGSVLRNKHIELSLGFKQQSNLPVRRYTSVDFLKYARLRPGSHIPNGRFIPTQNLICSTNARGYAVGRIERSTLTLQEEISEVERDESDIVSRDEYVPAQFNEITAISPNTQKALRQEFKYTTMSKVQDAVLSQAPIEGDLFVKAKTGTGKTLAFLIPAIETMLRNSHPSNDGRMVSIMILSPTRELAQQIATEAERLTRFYGYRVHCLVGGEKRDTQIRKLMKYRADIVVGTPGRIEDLLESVPHFRRQCGEIKTLILDEADQLLDMGFREDIERIIKFYPKDRQTFLFSATVSPQIRQISNFALRPDHTFIDTVDPNDVNTNHQIKQLYSITPYSHQLSVIRKIVNDHRKIHRNGKIMMFLPTKMSTMLYSDLIRNLDEVDVFELHSGKSQEMRTKISHRFRNSRRESILVTSDVSARGVDYPGVTMVLQVGAPSSREQYIHRIGRTGRAGKEGEGVLLLAPFEKGFMNNIEDLPLQPVEGIDNDMRGEDDPKIRNAIEMLDVSGVRDACMAALGYYSGKFSTHYIRKDDLVDSIQDLARSFGSEVRISPSILSRIGLKERGGGGGFRGGMRGGGGGRNFSRYDEREPSRFGDRRSSDRFNDNDSRPPRRSGDFERSDRYRNNNSSFQHHESRDRYRH